MGDCKSYTVLIASVPYNKGLPSNIRFTSYGTRNYRHVYPNAILQDGQQVVMDVVYPIQEGTRLFAEKRFTKKKDHYIESGLYKLGDTNNNIDLSAAEAYIQEAAVALLDIPDSIITAGPGNRKDIKLTTQKIIQEFDRELRMRQQGYLRQIASRKLSRYKANERYLILIKLKELITLADVKGYDLDGLFREL